MLSMVVRRSAECIIKTGAKAPVKGYYPYSAALDVSATRYLNIL